MANAICNITKEQYEKYHDASYDERNEFYAEQFPNLYYGYGIYGDRYAEEDGKYYIYFSTGNTCD